MLCKSDSLSGKLSIIKRIKRLSFMPLPISQYVDIIFDLIGEAILNSESKVILLDKFGYKYLARNIDYKKYFPIYNMCFNLSFEEVGVRAPIVASLSDKTVLTHEEIVHPNFYNGYIYNEIYRHFNINRIMLAILKENGQCKGHLPLFRTNDMPPFTKEDALFMESVAPYIAHGISKTKPVDESFTDGLDSKKPFVKLQEKGIGLILADRKGEIISMNDIAKNMFFQIGLLDGIGKESVEERSLKELISYVNKIIRNIFCGNLFNDNAMPSAVYTSRSGISIIIKGYYMEEADSYSSSMGITCEEVVPESFVQFKKSIRYNLSQREFEICKMLKEGYAPSEIAEMLNITKNTFKTHKANILNKLCLGDSKEIKKFLRNM